MRSIAMCCIMAVAGSAMAQTFDDYNGKNIVLAANKDGKMYAVTCNFPESGRMAKQEVVLNSDGKIVYLTTEDEQNKILWKIGLNSKSKIYLGSLSSGNYLYISDSNNLTTTKKNYFEFSNSYHTFTYTPENTSDIYGITLYGETFALEDKSFFKTYPIAKPYFLAEHTRRTLGASYFGTICFPKAVRAGEVAGATFYEISAKIMRGDEFMGIVLKEVTGDLAAGTPYIFKKADGATYIVAAMNGDAVEANSLTVGLSDGKGLVGTLSGSESDGGFVVPANMYILQGDQLWLTTENQSRLLAGRAYIDPSQITRTVAYEEASSVKGFVLGTDAPYDGVTGIKTNSTPSRLFDLLGREVVCPRRGTLNIIHGRKVIIK